MNQNRVPKGTPKTGGQFAEGRKPDGGDLTASVCPKCGGEVRDLPAYNPTDRNDPFPSRTVGVCGNCGYQPTDGGSASDLELAERLNNAHVAWQEFDDGEQLSKGDFATIYSTLDDTMVRLRGNASDPTSTSASDLDLADQLDDVKHMVRNFDEDSIPLSREDFDYVYGALETARERLGSGGPHESEIDTGYYCSTCDIYTYSAEEMCVDCGREMWTATSDARHWQIINAIFSEFATPDERPIEGMPNDMGVELLAHSSLIVNNEEATDIGAAWNGVLTINGINFDVSNSGRGDSNRYIAIGVPAGIQSGLIKDENDMVLRGFPGLYGDNALDTFCTLVQVVQENS